MSHLGNMKSLSYAHTFKEFKSVDMINGNMQGLCHTCLTSNVELVIDKGQIMCHSCFEKKQTKKD